MSYGKSFFKEFSISLDEAMRMVDGVSRNCESINLKSESGKHRLFFLLSHDYKLIEHVFMFSKEAFVVHADKQILVEDFYNSIYQLPLPFDTRTELCFLLAKDNIFKMIERNCIVARHSITPLGYELLKNGLSKLW